MGLLAPIIPSPTRTHSSHKALRGSLGCTSHLCFIIFNTAYTSALPPRSPTTAFLCRPAASVLSCALPAVVPPLCGCAPPSPPWSRPAARAPHGTAHGPPQGKCTAADCPYLHKAHAADAPVCRAFLTSHCPRGANCPARHLSAKMARERARLLTSANTYTLAADEGGRQGGAAGAADRERHCGKRRVSGNGKGAGVGTEGGMDAGAAALARPARVVFAGVSLNAHKRRRGGFRYFDADPEERELEAAAAVDTTEAASYGSRGHGAGRTGATAAEALPNKPAASTGSFTSGSEWRQGPCGTAEMAAAAAGKHGDGDDDCDDDGSGGPTVLPCGMRLYL